MKKTTKRKKTYLYGNRSYGLYYGELISYDAETGVAKVRNCRHVCRWYGKTGGITSLAQHGLCGSQAGDSRIGAPCATATLAGVVSVFECSPEAAPTFDAAVST